MLKIIDAVPSHRPSSHKYEVMTAIGCRHACATTWLGAGVGLGGVAMRLGHSVETLVTYYVGALEGDDELANERITDVFRNIEDEG